jgi:hypothetical protein
MKRRHRAIGNPTKAEQNYQDAARALGCIACHVRRNKQQCGHTQIHHRTIGDLHGQKQLGHGQVVALCEWHHQGIQQPGMTVDQMREEYGPSLHHHKRDFMEWVQDTCGTRSTGALQAVQDTMLAWGKVA